MSTISNAVNANQPGVQTLSSGGIWTGSTFSQYNTLVGGATNNILGVSPGTAGFVLTSNGAAANPTYQAIPGIVSELTWAINATNSFAMAATVGRIATFAGAIAVTLPTSGSSVGQLMGITINNAAGIATITMGTGQTIQIGATTYSTSVVS